MVARWSLAGLLLLAGWGAPRQAAAPPPPPSLPGTLHYTAEWRLLPAGTASLSWSAEGGLRQVSFTADASRLVNLFYPVHDVLRSSYDPATFCTQSVVNQTIEGRRHRLTRITYQPAAHQFTLDETDPTRPADPPKHEIQPLPGCVVDLLTALDYLRAQRLAVGDTYRFRVNEGGRTSDVQAAVDLRETVATPAGRFSAVRVRPTLVGGDQGSHLGQLWVWFSDDARHLPVQIQSHAAWGTLTAQLTNP